VGKKIVFGRALFSKTKQKAAGDHNQDDPAGKIQRQGLGEGI